MFVSRGWDFRGEEERELRAPTRIDLEDPGNSWDGATVLCKKIENTMHQTRYQADTWLRESD